MPTSLVDAGFAQWLGSPALYQSAQDAGVPAAISATGIDTELGSPLADATAGAAEAVRQFQLLGGGYPLLRDEHVVPGLQSGLLGQVVTISSSLYVGGAALCLVVGAEEQDDGTTFLEVVVSAWRARSLTILDVSSDWVLGGGVTLSGGVLRATNASTIATRNNRFVSGATYDFALRFAMTSGSRLRLRSGSTAVFTSDTLSGSGVVRGSFVAQGTSLALEADTAPYSGDVTDFVVAQRT